MTTCDIHVNLINIYQLGKNSQLIRKVNDDDSAGYGKLLSNVYSIWFVITFLYDNSVSS